MKRMKPLAAVMTVAVATLAGCTGAAEPTGNAVVGDEVPEQALAAPLTLRAQVELAMEDLAQRLDVGTDQIELSGARPVNWRSSALGCPEPGMQYAQVLVPGALIFLRANGATHGYHARFGDKPFYCPRERAEQPVFGQGADQI